MDAITKPFRSSASAESLNYIKTHIKSLSPKSRNLRFFGNVSDAFIDKYVDESTKNASFWIVVCSYVDPTKIVAALHVALNASNTIAEVGFSVSEDYTGQGIGTSLMQTALLVMKTMPVESVVLNCLAENKAVQAICSKVGISVSTVSYDEKEGTIIVDKTFDLKDLVDIAEVYRISSAIPILQYYSSHINILFEVEQRLFSHYLWALETFKPKVDTAD